ncbi:MAG: hypothetical protein KA760_16240, partial [Steroidobacteraceae bacterium]|nr:hypothetical protein [Steroidobacteraceae bacterium]
MLELSLTQRRKLLSLEQVLALASYEEAPRFLRNAKSGKVALCVSAPSHMDDEGNYIRRLELVRARSGVEPDREPARALGGRHAAPQ